MSKNVPILVNRRFIRIKVFQALYAYHRTADADQLKMERSFFESINKLYDLYLYLLALIIEVEVAAREILEQNKRKNLPTDEDLSPNTRFIDNRVFKALNSNERLKHLMERSKVSWKEEHDDIRKIFKQFREDEQFKLYMIREESNLQIDKEIITYLFREYLGVNDLIHSSLEEKNIYWQDDLPMAAITLMKTIQSIPENANENTNLLADLYKNKEEDQLFAKDLFRKAISFDKEYSDMVSSKADNWETERIALLDMILMQMALTELEHFSSIPVKVTLNEYIELAKVYSTPKSKVFINGVLDKLVAEMKRNERINKRGRGLVE
ncbi:MAG: transcription antitermination factor NusB [Salibacteraceae bacterium]